MALGSLYFNHTTNTAEQRLIEDLVTESIKIYGIEVGYLGKTIVGKMNYTPKMKKQNLKK